MSSDLIWQCIRGGSSFTVKRPGVIFSRECGNPTNVHAQKYSGVVGKSASVGGRAKKGVVLYTEKAGAASKPKELCVQQKIKKLPSATTQAIRAELAAKFYRPDLTQAVLARATKLHKVRSASQAKKN